MAGIVVLVLFTLLIMLRVPVSAAILMASLVTIVAFLNVPLLVIPQYIVHGMSQFEILAVPFFILAAEIMNAGGLTQRIFRFALVCVGWMPGGLAQVNVAASVVFAGISGTAVADAAGLGRVEIKAMREAGYDLEFSSAVTISSCLIGPLIPPSVPLIVYAIIAQVSVGKMLLAGVIPGLLLAALLMVFIYFLARRGGRYTCPVVPLPTGREFARALWEGIPALLAPILIVGGIVEGILTATEAGVAACLYSLVVALLIYRELTVRKFIQVMVRATLSSAMVMFLIGAASVMSWIVTRERVAHVAAEWLSTFSDTVWVQLLVVNVFLLIIGTALEGVPALLVTIPILLPVVLGLGVDPIHFGVIIVFNLLIAIVTPPVGVALFVVSQYTGLSVERLSIACLPFYVPLLATLFILTYVPWFSLFLPTWLLG